jgi:hypothetical protein
MALKNANGYHKTVEDIFFKQNNLTLLTFATDYGNEQF